MGLELNLTSAEEQREKLTEDQQALIEKLYTEASKEIAAEAKRAPRVPSDAVKSEYLKTLQSQINDKVIQIQKEIEGSIKTSMSSVVDGVVAGNIDFLKSIGMPIEGAFSHVADDVVRSVATGQLYDGNWSLSRALWKSSKKTQQDVQSIIAKGITENKSAYDIAKDLEKYVSPSARKDWEWSKAYPGTSKRVDYNAQRLARTMISHAYQQSFVRATQKNPFVTKYKWDSSNSSRVCPICAERDGQLYEKNELPLDHPNGMCTFEAVIDMSMDEVADRLGSWATGGEDPELDAWAKDLYTGENSYSDKNALYNPWEFNRISGSHTVDQDAKNSNPRFGQNRAYRVNCQRCVPTYELRRRGFDVIAKPALNGSDSAANDWYRVFKDTNWSDWKSLNAKRKPAQAPEIRSIMSSWGAGSRAEIYAWWDGIQSSHVFAAECLSDGTVVFVDPQNGSTGLEVESYFNGCRPSKTMILRTDNREFADGLERFCENAK